MNLIHKQLNTGGMLKIQSQMISKQTWLVSQLTLPHGSLALAGRLALTLASPIIDQGKRPLAILSIGLTHQCQLHRSSWTNTCQLPETSNIVPDLPVFRAFFVGQGPWVASVEKLVELGWMEAMVRFLPIPWRIRWVWQCDRGIYFVVCWREPEGAPHFHIRHCIQFTSVLLWIQIQSYLSTFFFDFSWELCVWASIVKAW